MHSPLSTPHATIARLQELGLYTRKSLGQHFLVDDNVIGRIIELAACEPSDTVIEVGPGIGTLTLALQERVAHIIAIEYDEALIEPLRDLTDPAVVEVVHADAARLLREDGRRLSADRSKMVSNLPYQVAATVILRAFESLPNLDSATVMVQKEVADRIRAAHSTKEYGAYTVKLALLAEPTGSFAVSPASFLPPPRVDSTVIRLRRREQVDSMDTYHRIRQVVDAAFGMRRKTLRNNLRTMVSDEAVIAACEATDIDPGVRAETLTVEQFIDLESALTTQDE